MNKIIVLLLLISPSLNAQIQFWDKDDIIEKQFEIARKEMKIKTAYNYIVGSKWIVNDSSQYNEVYHYNDKGRKTYYTKYKTDWASKARRYMLLIDSITYTNNNIFSELIRYTPKGKDYYLTYKAKASHNKKGNIERIDIYGGYMASELKKYNQYTYDNKDRVSKITGYSVTQKEKDYERLFEYDTKGKLISYSFITYYGGKLGGKTVYKITYNDNGLVESYKELYDGKDEQNKAEYAYDKNKRFVLRTYTTTTSYNDKFECYYRGNEIIPTGTRLEYTSGKGKRKSVRQNSLVYKFEFFD